MAKWRMGRMEMILVLYWEVEDWLVNVPIDIFLAGVKTLFGVP